MGASPEQPQAIPEQADYGESLLQADFFKGPTEKVRAALRDDAPGVAAQPDGGSKSGLPDQELDEETQKFIAQSLTDVDLFASYGLTQKAIGLLEAILRRAPLHAPTLEKLLDFVLGAGDDRRTAELAAQLEHIHNARGDVRSGERFGELRRRFQRAAGLSDEDIAAAVAAALPQHVETVPVGAVEDTAAFEVPVAEAEAVEPAAGPVPVEGVPATPPAKQPEAPAKKAEAPATKQKEEVDLSSEWASLLEETKPAEEPVAAQNEAVAPETGEMGLTASFLDQAMSLQQAVPPPAAEPAAPALSEMTEFEIPPEVPEAEQVDISLEEISAELPVEEASAAAPAKVPAKKTEHPELLPEEETTALSVPERAELASEKPEPALEVPQGGVPQKMEPEPELELDQDFELVLEPEPITPAHEMLSAMPPVEAKLPAVPPPPAKQPVGAPANQQTFSGDDFLSDLAKEMDDLGLGELTRQPAAAAPETAQPAALSSAQEPAAQHASGEAGPLKEVFDEFRAELGEIGAEAEDLETHYNLGIAFREMGLLEEAIGEFQKVAQANDRGKAFRYSMQCCTLLGLAFMEKGQPGIAAIWYERALQTPGMDTESKLALRYDLGVAQESAGELDAALKSFSQVYAINIDYRDVAERIHSLQKPAR